MQLLWLVACLLGVDGLVVGMLLLRQLYTHDDLLLLRQSLHVLFHSSQQDWPQLVLQKPITFLRGFSIVYSAEENAF